MKTVTLDVRAPADSMGDFVRAWKTGRPQKTARISFATPELLWRVLTEKRWGLLNAGVLDRAEDGRIVFPYEAVKVEFLLQAT